MGTISKLLGRASPTITQNIYVHWKEDRIKRAAQSVEIGKVQKNAKWLISPSFVRARSPVSC